MKAVIVTMARTTRLDNHADAMYVLEESQENTVLGAIQQRQLPDTGMLIIVEAYATIQKIGRHLELLSEVVSSQSTGNHPNAEPLHRQVIYFGGRGVLELRVVYTTNPLKRIVYDIADGGVMESHV